MNAFFIDNHTIDDLGVLDASARSLFDLDILDVHSDLPIFASLSNGLNGLDCELGKLVFVSLCTFSCNGGGCDFFESIGILRSCTDSYGVNYLCSLICCKSVTACNYCGMDSAFQQVFRLFQEFPCKHGCGCSPVSDFGILGFGDFHDHLCTWVLDVHFFEDCCSVVGDNNITHGVYKHLVHTLGPKSSSYRFSNRLCGHNIVVLGIGTMSSLAAFP